MSDAWWGIGQAIREVRLLVTLGVPEHKAMRILERVLLSHQLSSPTR